jgi:hypothetical protein
MIGAFLFLRSSWADEGPFFITYTHQMEEPGNLEIPIKSLTGVTDTSARFLLRFGISYEIAQFRREASHLLSEGGNVFRE